MSGFYALIGLPNQMMVLIFGAVMALVLLGVAVLDFSRGLVPMYGRRRFRLISRAAYRREILEQWRFDGPGLPDSAPRRRRRRRVI